MLTTLATNYRDWGRHAEAEALYERALDIRLRALGAEHPVVADTLEAQAVLLRKTGRGSEAAAGEARARAIRAALEGK